MSNAFTSGFDHDDIEIYCYGHSLITVPLRDMVISPNIVYPDCYILSALFRLRSGVVVADIFMVICIVITLFCILPFTYKMVTRCKFNKYVIYFTVLV